MAKVIDNKSQACSKSELLLFQTPPTQVVTEDSYCHIVKPTQAVGSTGPWEFIINASPQYLMLSKNFLKMKIRILNEDGTHLQEPNVVQAIIGNLVAPINDIGKTFWRQVKLYFFEKLVFDSGDMYAYRTYLETELNNNYDYKENYLLSEGYTRELTGYDEDIQPDTRQNPGWLQRREMFKESDVVELIAPVTADIFAQNKLMVSNLEIRLELFRNTDNFCLMNFQGAAPNAYKIEVQSLEWYVHKVELAKSVHLGLESALQKKMARYPIRRVRMTRLHIPVGSTAAPLQSVYQGQLPRRILLGFVDTNAYYGTYAKSPFNFKTYNITDVQISCGDKMIPRRPLNMNFDSGMQYTEAFTNLQQVLGLENMSNGLAPYHFKKGWCIFGFDLTPDKQDGEHYNLIKDGPVYLDVKFSQPVPAGGIEAILYLEFDSLLQIDKYRQSYLDFQA